MITSNIIHRVFWILFLNNQGTGFTIEVDKKQYLVTARHLVKNIKKEDYIQIFHGNKVKKIKVSLVGHCDKRADVSVLSTNLQLSPTYKAEPTMTGLVYGQDVYFLGFPYLNGVDLSKMNRGFPLPFVKKAIVSNMGRDTNSKKPSIVYLDGHNNVGFSGGPIVFKNSGEKYYKIGAIISGYGTKEENILLKDKNGRNVVTPLKYQSNTGIIIAYDIQCAIDVIKKNPIGFPVSMAPNK